MKVLNREEMITWLQTKGVNVVGTTEQFFKESEGKGIWINGEESNLFDYYSERWGNTFGVEPKLNEQTEKRGWFYEWYDAGTMMLWLN